MPATAASAVIDDRPQPPAPGLNDRFLRREADRPELLVGVEQQDAVLGDDADRP